MSSAKRRNEILQEVLRDGAVLVEDLADRYQLSVETIRRDLRILHDKGLLRRNYGGAEKKEQMTWEMPYTERINYHVEQKKAISKEVINLLENGDSVFLDGNTTGLTLSRLIPDHKELIIVTNSIMVAFNLSQKKTRSEVYIVGGKVGDNGLTSGLKLQQELKQYRFDKGLFSCAGITPQGLYFSKMEPQSTAVTLSDQSHQLILMADSSKMNQTAFLFGMETKRIHVLVTDEGIPVPILEKLRDMIPRVIVAKLDEQLPD
ncbi:DeoR/GlpR family DNA-binding transcription regulator [Paenibacillus glycinis]|uniref:DeoR family transcriptional regulator n=1 Tax=Paenibacillus glycinis TaxID=2697035 RepID=A0ABW9XK90_9BACL|nr:DeoR/GlpR family DNA-binding transcription regulator [Paenibacillus glycinis]NBD22971.1 DeoR family transcriptional regulator [Paenibacillus glycinis]